MPRSAKGLQRIIILVAILLLIVQVLVFVIQIPTVVGGEEDFRALYSAANLVRKGNTRGLYDQNTNQVSQNGVASPEKVEPPLDRLAYEALLFLPLTFLKYRIAYLAFLVINLALISVAIRMIWPYLERLPDVWKWFPPALFLCFLSTTLAIVQGADSIILLTLIMASAVSFYRREEWSSGIFLGLGLFNFQLVLPIALLFLCWRRWRIVAGFIIAGAGAILLSVILTGCARSGVYPHNFLFCNAQLSIPAGQAGYEVNTATVPNLRCLVSSIASSHISPHAVLTLTAIGSILILLWAATRPPSYALAVLVAVLVSQYERVQDGILLIIPIALVLDARMAPTLRTQEWSRNIAGLLFVAPTMIYLIGWRYCVLVPLMLALLIPLRSTTWGYDLPAAAQLRR
jgi:Glycosyltransferase family 87